MKRKTKASKKSRGRKHLRRHAKCIARKMEVKLVGALRHVHDEFTNETVLKRVFKMQAYVRTASQLQDDLVRALQAHNEQEE